uniref:DSHCT domain-containing protein n=1 Tax=Macrostomum lignano TaxID=282301 RepID=A0A1I8IDQ2_9PLAT
VTAAREFGEEIVEEPGYTIKDLMADMGGALGLWSGVSVLTACELIELIAYLAGAAANSRLLRGAQSKVQAQQEAASSASVAAAAASATDESEMIDSAVSLQKTINL